MVPVGAREVQSITAGKGMCHITLMVAASAVRTAVAPMLIFKGKQFRGSLLHLEHMPGLLIGCGCAAAMVAHVCPAYWTRPPHTAVQGWPH